MQWLTPVIPALWEAKVGRSPEVRSWRTASPTWWNLISTKNKKINWEWWHVPVIPATQEAEAGEKLELERQRLPWAKIMPLHSSLGNKSETSSKKKKKRKEKMCKRHEQILLKRQHLSSQGTYQKLLHITNHQRIATEKHKNIPYRTSHTV